jgi:hypothetical protein
VISRAGVHVEHAGDPLSGHHRQDPPVRNKDLAAFPHQQVAAGSRRQHRQDVPRTTLRPRASHVRLRATPCVPGEGESRGSPECGRGGPAGMCESSCGEVLVRATERLGPKLGHTVPSTSQMDDDASTGSARHELVEQLDAALTRRQRSTRQAARQSQVGDCSSLAPAGKDCIARINEMDAAHKQLDAEMEACASRVDEDGLPDLACYDAAESRVDASVKECATVLSSLTQAISQP